MSNGLVHTRYVAGSIGLHNFLMELGFQEKKTIGSGINKIMEFEISGSNKLVRSSYNELSLINIEEGKEVIAFRGYTVHDELLKFFSKRQLHDKTNI